MKNLWMRRRWFDFRQGHGVYLIFLLSFSNFVLIFHRMLIERITALDEIFKELWLFVVIFILIYIPTAILIGYWHNRTQMRVEITRMVRENPMIARMWRVLFEIQMGKFSQDEVKELLEILKSIEKKKKTSPKKDKN